MWNDQIAQACGQHGRRLPDQKRCPVSSRADYQTTMSPRVRGEEHEVPVAFLARRRQESDRSRGVPTGDENVNGRHATDPVHVRRLIEVHDPVTESGVASERHGQQAVGVVHHHAGRHA
jgi:hypothetical protein